MDFQELVRAITQEVLQRMQKDAHLERVVVLGARDTRLASYLENQLGTGYAIEYHDPAGAGLVAAGAASSSAASGTRSVRYILPLLSCTDLADLASGRASGRHGEEILRILLSGGRVEVLRYEYKEYSQSAPLPLLALYEEYEKKAASFGLVAFAPKAPHSFRSSEQVVTAGLVEEAARSGAVLFEVSGNAIVTPLAYEAAKNLNISIQKR